MDCTHDARNVIATNKSVTIYRNSAFNYSYVCFYCECSFDNISETLDHIEAHFNHRSADSLEQDVDISKANSNTEVELYDQRCESADRDKLNGYMKIHKNIVENQCKICQRNFSTPARLLNHLTKTHLNPSKLICAICSDHFLNKNKFKRHLLDHTLTNSVTCQSLIANLMESHKLKVEDCNFMCDICSLTFDNKHKLNLHMKREHILKGTNVEKSGNYKCDKCDRYIMGRFRFYAHQYEHLTGGHRAKPLEDVSLIQNLKIFLDDNVQHDELAPERPYGCKICCHLSVKRRQNIEKHILQEHVYRIECKKRQEKRYPCEYCGRKFALSHNMIVHKRIHTQEKPYKCLICNKSFSHSSYMKYHERVHTGVRTHQCSTCGLSFKSITKLNMHHKVHSDKIAKCPICDKEIKSHRLNMHIKHVHQNEHRPYKCTVCSQAFKTSQTLRTHSYRHSGEKKYECRFLCNKKFTSTAGRRGHERLKHETQ